MSGSEFVRVVRSACRKTPAWAVLVGRQVAYVASVQKDALDMADRFREELSSFLEAGLVPLRRERNRYHAALQEVRRLARLHGATATAAVSLLVDMDHAAAAGLASEADWSAYRTLQDHLEALKARKKG